ncbi:hypothetical protein BRC83_03145 [Halobacteriales archaeon QS_1_68_17]|nr:MAG: hypothetical protein BRC83_03145 [Halobacteriales archaeon QS_1_68_17]
MSNSQSYEEITVSSDGVTVVKAFEADEFPVPAIAFTITSRRNEGVTVRLVDQVPDGVEVEDLGFHPEYGSEYWEIDEDEIVFEREIPSGTEYTTVYGIRATGTDNVEQFLTEPGIESVDPPLEDEADLIDDSGSQVVRDVISGDADSVPGLDDDDEIGTLDLADPNDDGSGEESAPVGPDPADESGEADGTSVAAESLVEALAAEIRGGDVSDEDLSLLAKEVGLSGDDGSGSVEARIQHLQAQMSNVEAYAQSMKEFLDENGTGREMIEEINGRLDEIESALQDASGEISGTQDAISGLEDDVEEVTDDVASLEEQIEAVDESVGDIDDIDERIEDLESELDSLNDELGSVGDVEDSISDIEDDIEDLKEWREQLTSVLGAND